VSTVALIGALGAGKTSLRRLTEQQLIASKELGSSVVLVPISLWPFDSPEAAVRGILNAVVRELGYYVATTEIIALPEKYTRAVEGLGIVGEIISPIVGRKNPDELLDGFERVASAANLYITLWIEDLERFAGTQGASAGDDKLGPVRALLHLLERRENLNVVIASASLAGGFDIEKLARHVEHVPALTADNVELIMNVFRSGALELLSARIDPVRGSRQRTTAAPPTVLSHFFRTVSPWADLVLLCGTPRVLKQGLRHAWEVWHKLYGEIDLDDVIAMSLLRVGDPHVFDLVSSFSHDLRRDSGRIHRLSGTRSETPFQQALDRLRPQGTAQRGAIDRVLDEVFPLRNGNQDTDQVPMRPQGVGYLAHVDYWERFLTIPGIPKAEQDQPVLEAIRCAQNGDFAELSRLVSDPRRSAAVESFRHLLSPELRHPLIHSTPNA
jgi:hypothetical protein